MRGAPAIAIIGCLSLAVELLGDNSSDKKVMRQEVSVITPLNVISNVSIIKRSNLYGRRFDVQLFVELLLLK